MIEEWNAMLAQGQLDEAEALAAEIFDGTAQLGADTEEHAASFARFGIVALQKGDLDAARQNFEAGYEIRERVVGGNPINLAFALVNLGDVEVAAGDYDRAGDRFAAALAMVGSRDKSALDTIGIRLFNLGDAAREAGNDTVARAAYDNASRAIRAAAGADDARYPIALNSLALAEERLGEVDAAERDFDAALEATRTSLGQSHAHVAVVLTNRGGFYGRTGRPADAEADYKRAIEIYSGAKDGLGYAEAEAKLGALLLEHGFYADGEPLLREARAVRAEILGDRHPLVAESLLDLADAYHATGSYPTALELAEEAVSIQLEACGAESGDYAWALNGLAREVSALGDDKRATEVYEEAARITERAHGPQDERLAVILNNLAGTLRNTGDNSGAVRLLERVLAIRTAILGDRHPELPATLSDLAIARASLGDLEGADTAFADSLVLWQAAGHVNPEWFSGTVEAFAALKARTGDAETALALAEHAAAIDDGVLSEVLSIGAEPRQLAYVYAIRNRLAGFVSLVFENLVDSPAAVGSALDLVLRRRALVAELWAARRRAADVNPEVRERLDEIARLRVEIAERAVAGSGDGARAEHEASIHDLGARKEQLEAEIGLWSKSAAPELTRVAADRTAVAAALPEGSALVEIMRTAIFDFTREPGGSGPREHRYLAFVLHAREPESPVLVDLGEAKAIDAIVKRFRQAITTREDETGAGRELAAAVIEPLRPALRDTRDLLVTPDGALATIPLEAVPTAAGRLMDEVTVSYLSSGRDVLRFGREQRRGSEPLVLADPDYDLGAAADRDSAREHDVQELHRAGYPAKPLPGTRTEGETVGTILGVEPLYDGDAVEGAVKRARSPRVLHLATHGLFIRFPGTRSDSEPPPSERLTGSNMKNPLLRAGVVLAGFNTWYQDGTLPPEAEDGLLTGEDVAALDLLGTELVVLSACDTGLGDEIGTEGVFGLRRAFAIAGAATVVMSLWRVPDYATQLLMAQFYHALDAGVPCAAALHDAQRAVRERWPHPYFWAGFITLGDPSPIAIRP
jgi:CHAT domain-containing protein/tetratricopeptide (TPR) repeat protein